MTKGTIRDAPHGTVYTPPASVKSLHPGGGGGMQKVQLHEESSMDLVKKGA